MTSTPRKRFSLKSPLLVPSPSGYCSFLVAFAVTVETALLLPSSVEAASTTGLIQIAQNPETGIGGKGTDAGQAGTGDAKRPTEEKSTESQIPGQDTGKREVTEQEREGALLKQKAEEIRQMNSAEPREQAGKNKAVLMQFLKKARHMKKLEEEQAERGKAQRTAALKRTLENARQRLEKEFMIQGKKDKSRTSERNKASEELHDIAKKMKAQLADEERAYQIKRNRKWKDILGTLEKAKSEQAERAKGRISKASHAQSKEEMNPGTASEKE